MDKVFDNVKVYDFFGIWGAGIITLIYGIFSYAVLFQDTIIHYFQDFQADYSLLIIFCLSVIAYFLGTLLHEIGKWIYDKVTTPDTHIVLALKGENPRLFKKQKLQLYSDILNYREQLNSSSGVPIQYGMMIEALKAADRSKITDRYHALYGFMRGMMVGFCAIMLASIIALTLHTDVAGIGLVIADAFILWVLIVRTHRYYP